MTSQRAGSIYPNEEASLGVHSSDNLHRYFVSAVAEAVLIPTPFYGAITEDLQLYSDVALYHVPLDCEVGTVVASSVPSTEPSPSSGVSFGED